MEMNKIFLPLTEKYRPQSLDGIIGQEKTVETLKGFIQSGNVPNMLFHGINGLGKTATAHAFVNDFLGDKRNGNVIEINASSERTIDKMRELINWMRYLPLSEYL